MKASPHRHTPAIISLTAIQNNIKNYRKFIGNKPEIWAVVKANAYGHGAVKVSQSIEEIVDGFCVSNLDEAIELRNNLISKPILVLSGIVPEDVNIATAFNISLAAPSLEWLQRVADSKSNYSGLKIHLVVDSGMGRIGVRDSAEANKMVELADSVGIDFEGIFTHFATADERDDKKFIEQKAKFAQIVSELPRQPHYVHSTNSAAGLWHPEQVQSIERFGIAMYGLNPSGSTIDLPFELEPAFRLESELTHVKKIPAGASVGYGATFVAEEETIVGTVSIGYADGWTRDMQGFKVIVNGKWAEIIGRVSMDQMSIKLDQIYPIGTKVTLIGQEEHLKITATDIADWRKTINYEVLCLLSDRIYRKYE